MAADLQPIAVTGTAVLLFVAVFLAGSRVHPLRPFVRDQRSALSFGAGISIAYVFVRVMPELSEARASVVEAAGAPLPFEGAIIFFLALVGFLAFYGLEHLRAKLQESEVEGRPGASYTLHLAGFGAYVALLAYLLVRDAQETLVLTALYAVTIAVHLLGIDHSLREEHGAAYVSTGRFILAGTAILGWGLGLLVALRPEVTAALMAIISGAIIMNSAIMELPPEKDGRFWPFLTGGIVYGLTLMLLA